MRSPASAKGRLKLGRWTCDWLSFATRDCSPCAKALASRPGFFGACTAIPSERDRRFQRQIENEGQMQLMCPSEIKARQSAKIRQLAEAADLIGLQTLDEQAEAFGIPRSTAWTIRNGGHKASGLSVSIIDRMLSAPKLPPSVRTTLLEYIAEKTSGLYGGKRIRWRSSPVSWRRTASDEVPGSQIDRAPSQAHSAPGALRRLSFRDGNETTAYYTNNLEDAVHTAVEMARKRSGITGTSGDCQTGSRSPR